MTPDILGPCAHDAKPDAIQQQLAMDTLLRVRLRGMPVEAQWAAVQRGIRPVKEMDNARRQSSSWVLWMAAAASLAIVAGVWWFTQGRQPAGLGLRVVEVVEGVTRSKVAGHQPFKIGMELRQGDRVVVELGGTLGLKYDGEATTIDLHSAVATFSAEQGAKRVRLDSGLLRCTATHQVKPFRLETPNGVATVLGTRFALNVERSETRLSVQEGTVAMSQGTNSLVVKSGETVEADAKGLQRIGDEGLEWLQMLQRRAEVGSVVELFSGKGAYAQDGWRMDARGTPDDQLIWNVNAHKQMASILAFDTARWKRGVLIGRIMMLADGQTPPETPDDCQMPNPKWHVSSQPLNAKLREKGPQVLLRLSGAQPGEGFKVDAFGLAKEFAGTWCRMVIYFDTEADGGPCVVTDCWVEDSVEQPTPRVIIRGGMTSSAGSIPKGSEVGMGLIACDSLVKVNALKFVPLGSDMPKPPRGLVGRIRRWTTPNMRYSTVPGIGEAP